MASCGLADQTSSIRYVSVRGIVDSCTTCRFVPFTRSEVRVGTNMVETRSCVRSEFCTGFADARTQDLRAGTCGLDGSDCSE